MTHNRKRLPQLPGPRMPGIDMARALAILGMVLVNFRAKAGATAASLDGLNWVAERAEGKAAALFLVLAGVGISLRSCRARARPADWLRRERIALLERAAVLFVLGTMLLHVWNYDILHVYGLYLALAAAALAVPSLQYAAGRPAEEIDGVAAMQRELLLAGADLAGPGAGADALVMLADAFVDPLDASGPGGWSEERWASALRSRAEPTVVAALAELESAC